MNIKFSPKIAYPILVGALLVGLIIVSTLSNKKEVKVDMSKQMPNDEIHKGMNQMENKPSKDDVMADVKHLLEQYKKQIEKDSKDTLTMRLYAEMLSGGHNPADAIKYYNMILKINPKRTDILFGLTLVYYNNGDFENAEKTTQSIINLEPNNVQALYNLGAITAQRGDNLKAKKIFTDLIKRFPNSEAAQLSKDGLTRL
jgi:tetratricopeptide (TPR) repeat protein